MKKTIFFIAMLTATMTMMILFNSSASAERDAILAQIGDNKFMMSDLDRIIGYYDADKQKIIEQQPQLRATLLKRFIQGMVISRIAREKGFEKEPDVKEQLELLSNDLLTTLYVQKEVIDKIHVSDDDMRLYYKMNKDEFTTPEMVRARDIFIKVDKSAPDKVRKEAREKAEEILKKVKKGEDFPKLASEYSDDQTARERGGDLGFFKRGVMVPEFENAAFSLKPGQVSNVVETPQGFHIIKLEAKKEAGTEPYEKVKDKVRELVLNQIKKTKVEEFVEKAMRDAGVKFNFEALSLKK
jgi:peptidyl-prolyl cis-trans isomerase C